MKQFIIISTVFLFTILLHTDLFAQRRVHHPVARRTAVRHHHAAVHHRHPVYYSRTKIVVVRPRRVRTVTVMPAGHTVIVYKGTNYYWHTGLCYRYNASVYTVIAAPVGLRIRILPVGYRTVVIAGTPAYYYAGTYYKPVAETEEYETVKPEEGTIVPELPEDNVDEVTIEGKTYYQYDDMLYKAITTETGTQYEVVGEVKD